jgi:predicted phosphodiesterase
MKLQIISDIHLELFKTYKIKVKSNANALILAGDIVNINTINKLDNFIKSCPIPIFMITGNHEYYNSSFSIIHDHLKKLSKKYKYFYFLNNESMIFNDFKIIGSTLWSNFNISEDLGLFKHNVEKSINDFYLIKNDKDGRFTSEDCIRLNNISKDYIMNELQDGKPSIVITHFLPHPKSINELYLKSPLNPYFCCDCSDIFTDNIKLWIHGHTHTCCDYKLNNMRVVCNPKGYGEENKHFDGTLVVEI